MLQVFAGDDTFASYNSAREYADKLVTKTGLELIILDGDDLSSAAELVQPLESMSLFDSGKVVLAKRLMNNTKVSHYVEDNLKQLLDRPLVIWQDKKLDARTGLVKALKKAEVVNEYASISEGEAVNWLLQQAKSENVELPRQLAARLVEYKGVERGILHQELGKLIVYAQASDKKLDQSVLDSLTGTDATGDIWVFLDALAMGNRAKAIAEVEKLTQFSDNTQYLLSMLSRELTLMAQVTWAKQHGAGLQNLKLHPFVLEKASKKAARYTWQKLQKLSLALLRLDSAIKQGKVDEQIGLTVYLLSW